MSILQPVPWGFYKLLMKIKEEYGNPPVVVTENGYSDRGLSGLEDDDRVKFIRLYLEALLDAVDAGADVRGYAVWSLMDNFQWMDGYVYVYFVLAFRLRLNPHCDKVKRSLVSGSTVSSTSACTKLANDKFANFTN
jgi:beta-glucosidase/6-phospho-beta-glucosidase/beta-galactosidase